MELKIARVKDSTKWVVITFNKSYLIFIYINISYLLLNFKLKCSLKLTTGEPFLVLLV